MIPKDLTIETIMSHEEIVKQCKRIALWIDENYKGKNPVLIGLLKGCFPFMAELIKHIQVPFEIDFMTAKSYQGTTSTFKLNIIADLATDIKGRDVLIIEDIVDTGYTLTQVKKLFDSRGANSFKVVTLLDKEEARKHHVDIAQFGRKIKNEFVVGFGLDYNEQYRGVDFIGVMNMKYVK